MENNNYLSAEDTSESLPYSKGSSSINKKSIKDLLLERGLISTDQFAIAVQEQKKDKYHGKNLGLILIDLGFITERAFQEIAAEASGTKTFDLKNTIIDPNLIPGFPKEVAQQCKSIPVLMQGSDIVIAMAEYNIMLLDQLRKYLPPNTNIKPVIAPESEILELIDQYFGYEMSIEGILREIETGNIKVSVIQEEGYTNPTVRLVDAFLTDAIKRGASDIHLEPEESFLRVRYRIDGILFQIRSFHKDYWPAVAVRIKILSNMNITETRVPQDGRIKYNLMGRDIDFRVATQPTIYGENIVLRILDKKQSLVPVEQLGFSEQNTILIKKLLMKPEGIIIVTGPTGSGKTTTLYSILNYINSIEKNIMTLEDPVEYQLPLIRQSNIKDSIGWGFSEGIKSLLRQDPDVIFVGEIRDAETANMALRASMTGHQVYSTLHTNDAIGALPRLVDIGVPSKLLSGSLICIIAQRLARKLCLQCKTRRFANVQECKILDISPQSPPEIYQANKCSSCNESGYKGRIAINEILAIDKNLDELIALGETRKSIFQYAIKNGFKTMLDDGVDKVLKGIIDVVELIGTIDVTDRL